MEQKNLLGLVHVLSSLGDRDWQCVMVGDGPMRNAMEEEIIKIAKMKEYNMGGFIRLFNK